MKLAFQIARRYLVSKKSVNVINLISALSVIGVAVGTMALIVVLSAFNGIDNFVQKLLSSFDPDLKITAVEGKSFSIENNGFDDVFKLEGIADYTKVVEDNALLRYNNSQEYAVVKGVEDNYASFSGLDSTLLAGEFTLKKGSISYAVLGQGVANNLSVGLTFIDAIEVYYPKKEQSNLLSLEGSFNRGYFYPSAFFSVQQEIDDSYMIVPIESARKIFEIEEGLTSIEIKAVNSLTVNDVKKQIQNILGDQYLVQDRFEQHELIYRIMRSEKWSSFMILSFILVIASFNLLGSLTMIIIDKKDDIHILRSMGANSKLIRRIFLFEGWLVSASGATVGLILGIILVWAQKNFELLKFPGDGTFAISAYPVQLQFLDVLATLFIVLVIGLLIAWYAIRNLAEK